MDKVFGKKQILLSELNHDELIWDHTGSTSFQIKESSKSVHPVESYEANFQRPRVDRFVAPRHSLTETQRRLSWGENCKSDVVDIWNSKYLKQKKYKNYVDEVLGLDSLHKVSGVVVKNDNSDSIQPWPCAPRKKRFLSSANSILDLPTYGHAEFPELLDWGPDNVLVAALRRKYYKWSWDTQTVISEGSTKYNTQCCKFDPEGELLVLGTEMMTVEIHNNLLNKLVASKQCQCAKRNYDCSITAIDWSVTGNSFVTGCSRGNITVFGRTALDMITYLRISQYPILSVRISPDARFVSATILHATDGNVLILSWPWLYPFAELEYGCVAKCITWHPWRSALLAVGLVNNLAPKIALYDVAPGRHRAYTLGHSSYILDTMLFSNITGELVLSVRSPEVRGAFPETISQLVVMSNPDVVVDQWGEGRGVTCIDRVRTMVFSADETKLATATADEDLIIWNFLPENKDKKKKLKTKRFSVIPEQLDKATYGLSLR